MEFKHWKWDKKLRYSNENFTIGGNTERIIQPFPSDKTLARFAEIAYSDDYSKEDYKIPDGWELLTTARNDKYTNGYFGAAFWNSTTCQIIISHRGTVPTKLAALLTDARLFFNEPAPSQARSAITFAHKIREQCKLKRGSDIQLSITGHSLGAWLAQITTFTVKYMHCTNTKHFEKDDNFVNNIHPHTVVFESPGCRPALARLIVKYDQGSYGDYRSLDMTVYLSQQNWINSVKEQVGTIYQIPVETHSIDAICKFLHETNSSEQIQIIRDFSSGTSASIRNIVKKIIPITSGPMKTMKYCPLTCSLNVFDEYELKFLKIWNTISNDIIQRFQGLQEIKITLDLLNFQIDEVTHTIKASNNLPDAVARIKFKKYEDQVIYRNLGHDYLTFLELESTFFFKSLYKFEHRFKDLYGIETFLNNEKNTLCIELHQQDNYSVDASIINNILDQLQNKKYIFITSSNVNENLVAVLKNFDLLITGNFNNEPDENHIRNLLSESQITVKKIVLTSNEFINTLEGSNIQKGNGYGHKIAIRHLQHKFAEELLKRKNLKFHDKQVSLSDIINITKFSPSDENYNKIDKLLTPSILLEFLTTKMDYVYEIDTQISNFQQCVVYHNTYCEVTEENLKNVNENEQNLCIIQGHNDEIDDFEEICYKNPDKVVYWFVREKNTLYLEKYYSKKLYMTRKLVHKKILKDSVITKLFKSNPGYFLFCKNYEEIKMEIPALEDNKNLRCVANESSAVNISEDMDQAHILTGENGKIIWLRSNKHTYLMNYISEESNVITETDLTEFKEKLFIICGPPGSGKSAFVANLQQRLHQTSDDAWVFSTSLKTCKTKLKELNHNGDINAIAECILNMSYTPSNDFTMQMLVYCLKNKTKLKVYLLFDGFDELQDDDIEQKFVKMVSFLDHSTKANILITSRTYKSRYLENSLSTIASHLKEVEDGDIIDYLSNCWYTKLSVINSNTDRQKLEDLAAECLEQAKTTFGNSTSGLPMLIHLIAEVIEPSDSSKQINVLELYKKLIDNRYTIFFKKHVQVDKNGGTYLDWLSEIISRKHSLLAVIKVFNIDTSYVRPLKLCKDIIELNSVGFIQTKPQHYNTNVDISSPDNFDFINSFFEYYFTADLLVRWLMMDFNIFPKLPEHLKIEFLLIESILLKPEYNEIRSFINAHLEHNDKISDDQLKLCVDAWQKIENDPKYLENARNHDTLFHVCIRENRNNLITKLLVPFIKTGGNIESSESSIMENKITSLFTHRNQDDETILFLAVANESKLLQNLLDVVCRLPDDNIKNILCATFFKHSTEKKHLKVIEDFISSSNGKYTKMSGILQEIEEHLPVIKDFLNYLFRSNKKIGYQDGTDINHITLENENQAIEYLTEYIRDINEKILTLITNKIFRSYLLETRNHNKETPLHIAAKRKRFYLTKIYILLGCDLNKRDYHGMTPLARAVECGHKEIVELLASTGRAQHIPDNYKISPLAHAAKDGHLEIIKCLVENLKPDAVQKDKFNMIPLTWAVQKGHRNIVEYLLTQDTNSIDHIDYYGKTPLSHAIKLKNDPSNIAKYLLDKGASVDIPDRNGTTPLEYCLKMKKYDLINSLIDRGANVKFEYIQSIPSKETDLIKKLIDNINKEELSRKQLQELENKKRKMCQEEKRQKDEKEKKNIIRNKKKKGKNVMSKKKNDKN